MANDELQYFGGEHCMCIYTGELSTHELCQNDSVRFINLRGITVSNESRTLGIRLVETRERIDAACNLLNDRYAWRGYGRGHTIKTDPNHMTFNAEIDGEVVGTITLAIDGDEGLSADRSFRDRTDALRQSGAKICELKRFAFSPAIQSKELMAALFHIVFVYGSRTYGCTDLLIEVNERHVRFYESMLRFQRVGERRHNEVINQPVQLMRLEVAEIRHYIDEAATRPANDRKRSLYGYFFSPSDEAGIYNRLTRAVAACGTHYEPDALSVADPSDWQQLPSWQSYGMHHATSSSGSPTGNPVNHV